ncbi:MAG: glycosyltransferase [Thermoanaerobaculia bacterium]
MKRVSIVIATYGRHEVLVETLQHLLALEPPADEVLVVDQTPEHPNEVRERLRVWNDEGRIRWLRRAEPSIPGAMNDGLVAATGEVVLFVDDDIVPVTDLVRWHAESFTEPSIVAVAGQVLQPGERPESLEGAAFGFRSTIPQEVSEVMGGNFSIRRKEAIRAGGFDENFVKAAYRFEAEFCGRLCSSGGRIRFVPRASLRHLRAESGGTRAYGEHLRTWRPSHSVGEYYFLLLPSQRRSRWKGILTRPGRALRTRHHFRRPWWVPVTIAAEAGGLVWAVVLRWKGPRLLGTSRGASR